MNSQIYIKKGLPGIEFVDISYYTDSFKPHFHDHYLILTVNKGVNLGECTGKSYSVTNTDLLLINPSEIHTGRSWQEQYMRYSALYVSPEYLQLLLRRLHLDDSKELWFKKTITVDKRLAEEVRNTVLSVQQTDDHLVKEQVELLLISLIKKYISKDISRKEKMYCRKFVTKGVDFIKAFFPEPICIEDFCRQQNISYYSFIRSFRKYTGLTPGQYLINYRIEKAKEILKQNKPITDACWDTGFFDQSHFTRHFKSITGMTPGQYRRCRA
jgi:AraC-like DNA-binding protein